MTHLNNAQSPTNNQHQNPTNSDPAHPLDTHQQQQQHQPRSKCISAISTLCGHARGINDVAWSPRTGEVIATASDDKTLRLWDVTRGSSGDNAEGGLAGAPSVGTGGGVDHTIGGVGGGTQNGIGGNGLGKTISSPNSLVEFKGHSNFCFSVKFSPQGNLLVSGSFDETVKVWDVRSGECISTLPAHSDPVTGVDFNRDGTCIVSSSHDGLVRVWDVATGECLKTIYAEGNPPVSFVRYSPNGKYVLSGMLDGKLRLWNVTGKFENGNGGLDGGSSAGGGLAGGGLAGGVSKGVTTNTATDGIGTNQGRGRSNTSNTGTGTRCTKTYGGGHVNAKYCIFSDFAVSNPKRLSIVTGSEDGKIYLYDLQSRNVRQVLEGGHVGGEPVLAVAAHGSKEILASGGMSNDRTVRFWAPTPAPSGVGMANDIRGEAIPMEQ